MQNTSALYKSLLANQNHWFETKVRINNVDYGENMLYSVATRNGMFTGNPEVGKAVSGEIEVKMVKPSAPIPRMAKVEPFIRVSGYQETSPKVSFENGVLTVGGAELTSGDILDFNGLATLQNDIVYFTNAFTETHSEWIPKGVYYIDTREISRNSDGNDVMSFHGYDAMLFGEQPYPETSFAWPTSDLNVVNDVAAKMGVPVDPRTTAIINENYQISLAAGFTMREILGYIASMYVGSFVMTDTGKLRLVTILELPPETNYLIDTSGSAITFGGDRILV